MRSRPVEDGSALLMAIGPAEQIRALELDLTTQAAAARSTGGLRTTDQLRLDLLCERRGVRHERGPPPGAGARAGAVTTALGLSDEPVSWSTTAPNTLRWRVTARDDTSIWTSPSGRQYVVHSRDPPPSQPDRPLPTPEELAAHDRRLLTPDE